MTRSLCLPLTILAAMVAVSGCVTAKSRQVSSTTYQENDPKLVQVYRSKPARSHKDVARLVVKGRGTSTGKVEEKLRLQAARHGADAVVIDERMTTGSLDAIHARAVRWTGPEPVAVIDW